MSDQGRRTQGRRYSGRKHFQGRFIACRALAAIPPSLVELWRTGRRTSGPARRSSPTVIMRWSGSACHDRPRTTDQGRRYSGRKHFQGRFIACRALAAIRRTSVPARRSSPTVIMRWSGSACHDRPRTTDAAQRPDTSLRLRRVLGLAAAPLSLVLSRS
jgi:hypothetical protein